MGPRAVSAPAVHLDGEILTESRLRARCDADLPDRHRRVDVKGENRFHPVQHALRNEAVRAMPRFLLRLKNAAPTHRQRSGPVQRQRDAQQHCSMRVVPARMHDARILRAIGCLAFLGDRQGVDVRAQGHDRSVSAGGRDRCYHSPPAVRHLIIDLGGRQLLSDIRRGGKLLRTQLGVLVQVPSNSGKMGRNLFNFRIHPDAVRS